MLKRRNSGANWTRKMAVAVFALQIQLLDLLELTSLSHRKEKIEWIMPQGRTINFYFAALIYILLSASRSIPSLLKRWKIDYRFY